MGIEKSLIATIIIGMLETLRSNHQVYNNNSNNYNNNSNNQKKH